MSNAPCGLFEREQTPASRVLWPAASAFGLLVALPFLSNLHVTYSWSYPKLFALQTAVVIAWAGLLAVRPARVTELLSASGVGAPIAAVLAWAALSVAWSDAPWAAMQPMVELIYMALAVIGLANFFADARARTWFVAAYGCSAGGACLAYALCSFGALSRLRVYPFDNPNVAAAFALVPLTTGAAFALSALAGRVKAWAGVLGAAVAACAVTAIVVSESAAASAGAVGGLALVGAFSLRGRARRVLLEVLAGLVVLTIIWPTLAPSLWPGEWLTDQLGPRPAMWQGAVELARERPVVGHGVGSFFVDYSRVYPLDYATHSARSDILENAHNLSLHVLVELGIVGLALAAWLVVAAFRRVGRAASACSPGDGALLRGLACGGLAMLAQGLVSTSLHQPECSVHLVLALALIGGMGHVLRQPAAGAPTWLRIGPVVVLLAFYVVTAGSGLTSQIYVRKGMMTAPTKPGRIDDLRKGIRASWPTLWTMNAREELARSYYLTGRFNEALEQLEAIDRLAPNLGTVRRTKAALLLRLGRTRDAADAIATYCRKDPTDLEAYGIWLGVLKRAVEAGRPELAQPSEALKLLGIAERADAPRLPAATAAELRQSFLGTLPPH